MFLDDISYYRHEHNYIRSIALKDFRSDQQMDQMLRHVGNHCSRLKEVELLNCCVRSDTLIRLGMLSLLQAYSQT